MRSRNMKRQQKTSREYDTLLQPQTTHLILLFSLTLTLFPTYSLSSPFSRSPAITSTIFSKVAKWSCACDITFKYPPISGILRNFLLHSGGESAWTTRLSTEQSAGAGYCGLSYLGTSWLAQYSDQASSSALYGLMS